MIFSTHEPLGYLDTYIESIFHYQDFVPDHSIERVIPTGHCFLIFELDGFERNTFHNDTLKPRETFTKAWISGVHEHYISISAHKNSEMLVVQFRPYGAHAFFHSRMDDLKDRVVPAEQVVGDEVLELQRQMLLADSVQGKFGLIEQWLHKRFNENNAPSDELMAIANTIAVNTTQPLGETVATYSKTQKHLIDQFKKYIGITPKYYQRIHRFNELLQMVHKSEEIEWSQVAYQFEYSDQSHFIKEFKHFSGLNPEKFIRNGFHKTEPNFFPLDRHG